MRSRPSASQPARSKRGNFMFRSTSRVLGDSTSTSSAWAAPSPSASQPPIHLYSIRRVLARFLSPDADAAAADGPPSLGADHAAPLPLAPPARPPAPTRSLTTQKATYS